MSPCMVLIIVALHFVRGYSYDILRFMLNLHLGAVGNKHYHKSPEHKTYYTMPLPHDLCARLQNAFRARHQRIAVDHTTQNLGILSILLRNGFLLTLTRGTTQSPDPAAFHAVNDAQKRIWADLKYRDDRPVLNHMELVSMPSKRIFMDVSEIRRIVTGRRAQVIKPLGMGEIAIVKTKDKENEWLEAREALRLNLPGEVVCRAG
ncbi:ribosomal protein S8 [Ramaria rubella]|nr:ribosomal protein S8 [Ramaria rubella]